MGKFTEEELAKIFEKPTRANATRRSKPKYDVKVTLNGNGPKNRQVIRFGFRNHGSEVVGQYGFAEASNIELTKNRVYFRMYLEKQGRGFYAIQPTNRKSSDKLKGCHFAITPSAKSYRMYMSDGWIGRTFPLLFDEENNLYYIENCGAATASEVTS